MSIRITDHVEFPPAYICATCLQPTLFRAGEKWQMCEESHFMESRTTAVVSYRTPEVAPSGSSKQTWMQPRDDSYGTR
jgi:hypothetical protein